MNSLNLAENIVRLRREKKITQEQLAEVIGVTKASVSKWETKQSMPDVLLLPQLATFFGVTIDALLGYEPQLCKEQIQKQYYELTKAFAEEDFETVMERSRMLVKQYYSCYEFLLQIAVLWLNHYMLPGEAQGRAVLKEAKELCDHVQQNCKEIRICNDAIALKAALALQLGEAAEVVELLEEISDPCRLGMQNDATLIGAYMLSGERKKADEFNQISTYIHLQALMGGALQELLIHSGELERCEETMRRVMQVVQAYRLEDINANSVILLHYRMAMVYLLHGKKGSAISELQAFVQLTQEMLKTELVALRSDDYFTEFGVWLERLTLGGGAPRDKRIIYDSMIKGLEDPVFEVLKEEKTYQKLLENARCFKRIYQ
ncbi:MAG: helix-turn-helix transcriptional regulator [Lachnospiraceae bacterium]|nr:helix-turn-helix transcriptional regulator [Lachnospiraceae bacterium]